ncbi:MAG: gluconate transporter [Cyclobacteriaceae bacterium]|nr:gluconate transporter [Cyclobacteriaceae bacterium]
MSFLIVVLSILLLVVLISYFKVNAFLSFLIVSILCGLFLGIDPADIESTIHKGMGDMLGSLVIVILAGSMLGKLVAETGAAQKIATSLMSIFGQSYLQLALMITGFVIGIPLFYNVGFVLVFPLIASVVYRYKLPALYIGMPIIAALSVTHGFLPPHPSPSALVAQLNASMSVTLLYGIMIAIPTVLVAGLLFSQTLKKIPATVLKTFQKEGIPEDQLPGLFNSIFTSLLPVLLLATTSLIDFSVAESSSIKNITQFLSGSSIVMLVSLIIATYTLGISRGLKIPYLMEIYSDSVKDVLMIVLIIGGAGALKQTLIQSGVDKEIGDLLDGLNMHPLILGWLIASIIRVCVGSATVAGLTAAGIVAPLLISHPEVNPSLMVLAVGAGSLMFSHVNDAGFWLFKEYFNLSIKDTIRSWSLMETLVAVCGLIGVMLINAFI